MMSSMSGWLRLTARAWVSLRRTGYERVLQFGVMVQVAVGFPSVAGHQVMGVAVFGDGPLDVRDGAAPGQHDADRGQRQLGIGQRELKGSRVQIPPADEYTSRHPWKA